ncbi:MAG: helix-turn-helix transcriptional regulator [Oleibacter sp.]|nr:helix-turn-helix transcriptional regulator [Thalassolituus sp.]
MSNWVIKSDNAILVELAEGFKQNRLARNLTQHELAAKADVSVSTVRRFERGEGNISLLNIIALMRALGNLDQLSALMPTQLVQPMTTLHEQGAGVYNDKPKRQRASKLRSTVPESGWQWNEDS